MTYTVGVDFGGTNIKIGLVDARGCIVRKRVLSSRGAAQPAAFITGVAEAVRALCRAAGLRPRRLRGIGVGVPGQVDVARGVAHHLVNVPGWREVPLANRLAQHLGCPCAVDNDANVFTLAEWRVGAGRGTRDLIGLTLGTGVGGGLIVNGALARGAAGAAGEIGHMVVDPTGPRCGCGRRGCWEALVGTAAVIRSARQVMRRRAGPLRTLGRYRPLTPALVSEAARRGDAGARAIWHDVGRWLGVGLTNLVHVLNPQRIVIGGGVANAWPFFEPAMRRTLRQEVLAVSAKAVRIVRARLGEEAGIVGAAVLVWEETR